MVFLSCFMKSSEDNSEEEHANILWQHCYGNAHQVFHVSFSTLQLSSPLKCLMANLTTLPYR